MTPRCLVLVVLLVALAAPAYADTILRSIVLQSGEAGSSLICTATNVGKNVREVLVFFLNEDNVHVSGDIASCTLTPQETCSIRQAFPGGLYYCLISHDGGKKDLRGAIMVTDTSGVPVLHAEIP